jgi:hypothetical protein
VDGGDGLLVELGEEDVSDGVVDGVGGVLEEVGEADVEAAFAQADGGVEAGKAAEADVEGWDWGSGAEVAVLLFKYGDECGGGHCFLKVARRSVGWGVGCRSGFRVRVVASFWWHGPAPLEVPPEGTYLCAKSSIQIL